MDISEQSTERRHLAAILAADVVGYSRKMEADERSTLKRVRELRESVLRPTLEACHGRLFKTMGDGFLVEFASVADAVHCAVGIQKTIAERNRALPEEARLELRIGINLGDVFREGEDLFGDGVNLAARLEGFAAPGGVCISRAAHDQIREKLDFAFEDLGEHQFKNISRPIQVFHLQMADTAGKKAVPPRRRTKTFRPAYAAGVAALALLASVLAWQAGTFHAVPKRPAPWSAGDRRMSFAILNIEAPKDDPAAQDYAAALTDELSTDIGRQRYAGFVAPRSKVSEESRVVSQESLGRRLNVAFIIEAKVRRENGQFETRATVANVATTSVLGSASMLEPPGGSHDLSRAALLSLSVKLFEFAQHDETERVRAMPDVERDARDLVSLSWPLIRRSKVALDQVVALRERAVALAPDQPNALAALGTALALRASGGWSSDKAGDLQRAKTLLDQAQKTDPDNLYAMQGREMYYVAQRKWNEALIQVRQIIALDPAWVREYHTEAEDLLALDRAAEALDVLDHQPFTNGLINMEWSHALYGRVYFALTRYADAAERLRSALVSLPPGGDLDWTGLQLYLSLAACEALLGKSDAATRDLHAFFAAAPKVKRLRDVAWDEIILPESAKMKLRTGLRLAGMPE